MNQPYSTSVKKKNQVFFNVQTPVQALPFFQTSQLVMEVFGFAADARFVEAFETGVCLKVR